MLGAIWGQAFKKRTPLLDSIAPHGAGAGQQYSFFDLLCVGLGATVGSGIFVVAGQVAHETAGPAVILSWCLAGLACCLSALAYAELTCRWPSAGSSYTFVYATLGEWLAVLTALSLTLECGISGAAVARSWGAKVAALLQPATAQDSPYEDQGFNLYAALLQLGVVLLFACGVGVSRLAVNWLAIAKAAVVLLLLSGGLLYYQPANLHPFTPYGMKGVMKGATTCFFGFIGYDEVCCLAQETADPRRLLPAAIFATIFSAAFLYSLASLALVGMRYYEDIDSQNSFYSAFRSVHEPTLATCVAVGELATMPLVVMASFLPQPRLLYALGRDKLAPAFLANTDLTAGVLLSGAVCVVVAAFVPYATLNNLVSGGVLLSFNLTNIALILLRLNRHREGETNEKSWSLCEQLISLYVVLCCLTAIALKLYLDGSYHTVTLVTSVCGLILLATIAVVMFYFCPAVPSDHNYTTRSTAALDQLDSMIAPAFHTPGVPFVPLLAIFLNTYLIVQLSSAELLSMLGLFLLTTFLYAVMLCFRLRGDGSASDSTMPNYGACVDQVKQAGVAPSYELIPISEK